MPQYAAAFAAGVLATLYGNNLADPLWSAFSPLLLLLARYNGSCRLVLIAAAGLLWSNACFYHQLQFRLADEFDNRPARVQVRIGDLPTVANGRVRLEAEVLDFEGYRSRLPRRLRLTWYQDRVRPGAGEVWRFEVKLKQPRAGLNPAGFDFEKWMFLRGIDASGYIRDSRYNQKLASASALNPQHWRARLALSIDRLCPDCAQRGLIKALALGFRGDIEAGQAQQLRASGTAHLLAISGLHVGLVAAIAFFLGRLAWRLPVLQNALNRDQVAALVAFVIAIGYAALAGFTLPTLRALIMLSLVLGSLLLKHRINLLQSISIAALLILLLDPAAIGSASFWLSLGAVLVIGYTRFRGGGGRSWWRELLYLQFYFSVLFAPVGLLIFGQLTPASYLANLVAIPLVSFAVLPLVLLACLLSWVLPPLAGLLFSAADMLLALKLALLQLILDSGLAPVALSYPPLLLLTMLVALAWLLMPWRLPGRGLALLLALLLPLWQPPRPAHGEFEAIAFDVGQGTSLLLRTRHHSLVYDFGPGRPGLFSAAERVLVPSMRYFRTGVPDLAVVSHADQDHSGGLPGFLRHYPAARLVSGTPRRLRERYALSNPVRSCHGYPDWRWDGVDFRFIGARPQAAGSTNASCVLLVAGLHRLLLPGDIESARESELIASHAADLEAEILLAPHHGSGTSSSRAFVDAVKPRYVVYTMARANPWGFPQDAVRQRYQAVSARELRSDRDGAISIVSANDGLSLRRARLPPRRIWRRW